MLVIKTKYDPWDGVNFLPKNLAKQKLLHMLSFVIVITSMALLVYPFTGLVGYVFANMFVRKNAVVRTRNWEDAIQRKDKQLLIEKKGAEEAEKKKAAESKVSEVATKAQGGVENNKIIIPKIGVDMEIKGEKDKNILYHGVAWHIPGTSNPQGGGNMVLGAHRYLYRPPNKKTFYLLDKLSLGDSITLYWEGKEFNYVVYNIKIVEPHQVEILAPSLHDKLTLFTCTPLFTSKQRLVVEAKPI